MRLTTHRTATQAHRPGRRGVRSLAAFAALAVAIGLSAPATAATNPADAADARPLLDAPSVSVLQDQPTASVEGDASGERVPVAVAVVEEADGSLVVETHPAGSVASATRIAGQLREQSDVVAASVDHRVSALAVNDPYFSCGWALQYSGNSCDFDDDGVDAYETPFGLKAGAVWKQSKGAGVVVAVVDSGVRASHEDLGDQVLDGVDFVGPASNKGKKDYAGHGTHVAGIIAAKLNNKRGLAGLAPAAKILPVRVLDAEGSGYTSDIVQGIIWAVDHGADVINMSLGSDQSSSVERAAVDYALDHGVLIVASAGNSAEKPVEEGGEVNPVMYPAAYPGVLAVGATEVSGDAASFSERQPYVAVAAPGVDILSSYIDGQLDSKGRELCPASAGDCYVYSGGTSMAAPFVTATAALLLARNKKLSPASVRSYITSTATDDGTAGRDTAYGFGHLNPVKAVNKVIANTPTTAGVRVSSSRVKVGSDVTVTAKVGAYGYGVANRKVVIQRKTAGSTTWKTVKTATTNSAGEATYRSHVSSHQHFRAIAYSPAGPVAGVSTTKTVVAVAKVARTGTSPRADRVTIKAQAYPKVKVTVKLQRKVGTTWRTIATKKTSSTGAVTFSKVTAPTGKRSFRVITGKSTLARGGKSTTLKINVK